MKIKNIKNMKGFLLVSIVMTIIALLAVIVILYYAGKSSANLPKVEGNNPIQEQQEVL